MIRLPGDTPVRISLPEAEAEVKFPRRILKTIWLASMKEQLKKEREMEWEVAKVRASDRYPWKLTTAEFKPQWVEVP